MLLVFKDFSIQIFLILFLQNLFYSFDCLYRSKYRSSFTVLTTFEEIPMVKTSNSLQDSLALISSSLNQQETNSVFQLSSYRPENLTTVFFISNNNLQNNFQTIFNPLEINSFDSSGNTVSKMGNTMVSSFRIYLYDLRFFSRYQFLRS